MERPPAQDRADKRRMGLLCRADQPGGRRHRRAAVRSGNWKIAGRDGPPVDGFLTPVRSCAAAELERIRHRRGDSMHSKTRCILLAVLGLMMVPALAARSDDAVEKALRDRREAL